MLQMRRMPPIPYTQLLFWSDVINSHVVVDETVLDYRDRWDGDENAVVVHVDDDAAGATDDGDIDDDTDTDTDIYF